VPTCPAPPTPQTFDLDATYFDTDDLRLARHRRTLRRRSGGSDAGWHLKTPATAPAGPSTGCHSTATAVPAELQTQVRAFVRRETLQPVARLRTRRAETPLRDADGRTLAVIAQDHVRAETACRAYVGELEVELVDGGPEDLERIERSCSEPGHAREGAVQTRSVRSATGSRHRATLRRSTPSTRTPARSATRSPRTTRERATPIRSLCTRCASAPAGCAARSRRSSARSRVRRRTDPVRAALAAHQLGEVRDGQVLTEKLVGAVDREGPQFTEVAAQIRDHLEPRWRTAAKR
jgi:uncharacterized protein YjbK